MKRDDGRNEKKGCCLRAGERKGMQKGEHNSRMMREREGERGMNERLGILKVGERRRRERRRRERRRRNKKENEEEEKEGKEKRKKTTKKRERKKRKKKEKKRKGKKKAKIMRCERMMNW